MKRFDPSGPFTSPLPAPATVTWALAFICVARAFTEMYLFSSTNHKDQERGWQSERRRTSVLLHCLLVGIHSGRCGASNLRRKAASSSRRQSRAYGRRRLGSDHLNACNIELRCTLAVNERTTLPFDWAFWYVRWAANGCETVGAETAPVAYPYAANSAASGCLLWDKTSSPNADVSRISRTVIQIFFT